MLSPSLSRITNRIRSSITELSFHGIPFSAPFQGKKCNPCLRYVLLPMSQAAHSRVCLRCRSHDVLEEPVEFGLGKVFDFDSPPLLTQFDNTHSRAKCPLQFFHRRSNIWVCGSILVVALSRSIRSQILN